jgi:REP element-mobilizing transposase RayT
MIPAVRFPKSIRLPAEAYADPELRFHVTISGHPGAPRWSPSLGERLWALVMDERGLGRVEIFAACLMPDHLHLLLRPGELDVIRFLNSWKSFTTRESWRFGRRGALWQPGMWDRTIRHADDFDTVVRYIVANPVVAGLVDSPEAWPWTWSYYGEEGG